MIPDFAATKPELPRKPSNAEAASARTDPHVVLHPQARGTYARENLYAYIDTRTRV